MQECGNDWIYEVIGGFGMVNVISKEGIAEMLLKRFNMNACMECQNELLSDMVAVRYEKLCEMPEINTDKKQLENIFQYIRFGFYSMVCDFVYQYKITPNTKLTDEQRTTLYEYKRIVESLNTVAKGMGFDIEKNIDDSKNTLMTVAGYHMIVNKI